MLPLELVLSIQRAESITQGQSASTCTTLTEMPFLATPLKYPCASAKAPLSIRFPHLVPRCFTDWAKGNQGKGGWKKLYFIECIVRLLSCVVSLLFLPLASSLA